jgi:hypothetical protein
MLVRQYYDGTQFSISVGGKTFSKETSTDKFIKILDSLPSLEILKFNNAAGCIKLGGDLF